MRTSGRRPAANLSAGYLKTGIAERHFRIAFCDPASYPAGRGAGFVHFDLHPVPPRDAKSKNKNGRSFIMTASQPLALSQGIVINDRFTSFPDLEERVKRLAGGLAALGIKAGDSVAILLRNDTPFLEVTYGAMLLGAYAVPINWHFRTDEVLYILEDCGAKVLVAHSDLLMGLDADLPAGITVIEVDTAGDIVAREVTMARRRALEPAILDYAVWVDAQTPYAGPPSPPPQSMIYTSGTTGRPKGVRRDVPTPEQVAAVARMRSELYGLTPGLRAMLAGPMYHSAPNAFAVRAGQIAELFVIEPYFDPERFLQVVEARRIDRKST